LSGDTECKVARRIPVACLIGRCIVVTYGMSLRTTYYDHSVWNTHIPVVLDA
jgi:hypothetical protein